MRMQRERERERAREKVVEEGTSRAESSHQFLCQANALGTSPGGTKPYSV
jgi:hypothetical protein